MENNIQPQPTSAFGNPSRVLVCLLILALVIVVTSFLYFTYGNSDKQATSELVTSEQSLDEYTIMNVPYWGMYAGSKLTTPASSVAYSILQYWGDDRYSLDDIAAEFPYAFRGSQEMITTKNITDFFLRSGYEVESIKLTDTDKIKVAMGDNVPVIISNQKLDLGAPEYLNAIRLIIGYSNANQHFIVHGDLFGNNYEMSYAEFEQLSGDGDVYISLVTPGIGMTESLTGPNPEYIYPERLDIMNSPDIKRVIIKWKDVSSVYSDKYGEIDYAEVARRLELVVTDTAFDMLHPAARMFASLSLAEVYTLHLGRHTDAITLLEKITLPQFEYNFNEAYGEWKRYSTDMYDNISIYTTPWTTLGIAHLQLGDFDAANTAFAEAEKLDPDGYVVQKYNLKVRKDRNDTSSIAEFTRKYITRSSGWDRASTGTDAPQD